MPQQIFQWPALNREPGRLPWMMQVADTDPTLPAGADEVYIFEKNPYQMDSPFRSFQTTASGEILGSYTVEADNSLENNRAVLRTKYDTKTFSFSGKIWTREQYQRMSDFYNYDVMIALRDHFGRVYVVRFIDFECQPQIPTPRLSFKWDYKVTCQLYAYIGESTNLLQTVASAGKSFNGYGEGSWSVEQVDSTANVTTFTLAEKWTVRSDWASLGNSSWASNWASEVASWYSGDPFDTTRYPIWVIDPPLDLYQALSSNNIEARRCVAGIALALDSLASTGTFGEGVMALGMRPYETLFGQSGWIYAESYNVFKSEIELVTNSITPMNRFGYGDANSWNFNGKFSDSEVSCLYMNLGAAADMQPYIDSIYTFRQTLHARGIKCAVSVSFSGTPQNETTGSAYQKLYSASRADLPDHAPTIMFWYEDYRAAFPTDPLMNAAYAGIANATETVTDEIVGAG